MRIEKENPKSPKSEITEPMLFVLVGVQAGGIWIIRLGGIIVF